MDRVLRATAATVSRMFYEDGVPVDPGTVTVSIVRADGTSAVAGASTAGTGAAARTYNLAAGITDLLDTLTVSWVSPTKGTLVSTVEVVGGFLFSLAEARAFGLSETKFAAAEVIDMRTTVEQEIEQACGVAFVPRYTLETVPGSGGYSIMLRPYTSLVRTATLGLTSVSPETISGFTYDTTGVVSSPTLRWSSAVSTVGYEHGMAQTPLGIRRAALILAKDWLLGRDSPISERATTFGADNGISYSLAVAGRGGSHFGIPDVDAAIDRYSLAALVA